MESSRAGFESPEDIAFYEEYSRRYGGPSRRLALEVALAKAGPDLSAILVVGCGPGSDVAYLAGRRPAARIVAVDFSANILDAALGHLTAPSERIEWLEAEADAVPAELGPFPLILSHGSFRRWRNPAAALAGLRQLLTPDGLMYVSDVRRDIPEELVTEIADKLADARDRAFFRQQIESARSLDEVRDILAAAGIGTYELAIGGLGGHPRTSPESWRLVSEHPAIRDILAELFQGGGYGHPRSSEAVLHLYIRSRDFSLG